MFHPRFIWVRALIYKRSSNFLFKIILRGFLTPRGSSKFYILIFLILSVSNRDRICKHFSCHIYSFSFSFWKETKSLCFFIDINCNSTTTMILNMSNFIFHTWRAKNYSLIRKVINLKNLLDKKKDMIIKKRDNNISTL